MFLNFLALVNGRIKLQLTEIQKTIEGAIGGGRWCENEGFKMPIRYPSGQVKSSVGFINWSSGERPEHLIWNLSTYNGIQS